MVARLVLALMLLAGPAWAHDHQRPDADQWFASLQVPQDGLALPKGSPCCDRQDCRPRAVQRHGPGLYSTKDDAGRLVTFTDRARIDDPAIRESSPYFSWVVCIWPIVGGEVVCAVPGRTGI